VAEENINKKGFWSTDKQLKKNKWVTGGVEESVIFNKFLK
jgi:hypothetical protein